MSMSPIAQTVQGQPLTFLLTKASLNAVLSTDALNEAFQRQRFTLGEAMARSNWSSGGGSGPLWNTPTQTMWADMIAASSPASMSQIPPEQICAIIREALVGGGMAVTNAIDTADRIYRNQLNRAVDFLAATIVKAAIAAG